MTNFMTNTFSAPLRWGTAIHAGAAIASVAAFNVVKTWLDARYAASKHPVDFMTGQTGFDADAVKGYYAEMEALGTLPIYVQTQLIDFLFIICFALMGWMFGSFIARLSAIGTWGRWLGMAGGLAVVFGTLMDTAENLTSFIMLADPQGFPAWLAMIYSGFAVTKFASITLGMVLMLCSLALAIIIGAWRLFGKFRQQH